MTDHQMEVIGLAFLMTVVGLAFAVWGASVAVMYRVHRIATGLGVLLVAGALVFFYFFG